MDQSSIMGIPPHDPRLSLLEKLKEIFSQAYLITEKGIKYFGEIHIPLPDKDVFVLGDQTFLIVAHTKKNGKTVWTTPPLQVYEIVNEFERSENKSLV